MGVGAIASELQWCVDQIRLVLIKKRRLGTAKSPARLQDEENRTPLAQRSLALSRPSVPSVWFVAQKRNWKKKTSNSYPNNLKRKKRKKGFRSFHQKESIPWVCSKNSFTLVLYLLWDPAPFPSSLYQHLGRFDTRKIDYGLRTRSRFDHRDGN